jgi:hypothetical protein
MILAFSTLLNIKKLKFKTESLREYEREVTTGKE